MNQRRSPKKQTGTLIAVGSTRGGIGASTLATGIASAIAKRTGEGVLLVDACPKGGQLAARLGLYSHPNMVGLTSSITDRAISQEGQRKQIWMSHAQQANRGRYPLWVVASAGEPLSAHWYAHKGHQNTAVFLAAVAESGVPVVCDVGEMSVTSQLGWSLAHVSSATVLMVAGSYAPASDIDVVFGACYQKRTLLVVPAPKQDKKDIEDFWAHAVLGGWGTYQKQLIARSNVEVRLSEKLFDSTPYLGTKLLNVAQQELLKASHDEAQILVPAPVGVEWFPWIPSAASLCGRGSIPAGPFGKAITDIAALACPAVAIGNGEKKTKRSKRGSGKRGKKTR